MSYRRLDQILRAKGQISEEQVTEALNQQSIRGGRLGEHLLSSGDINETELVDALSEQLHVCGVALKNRSVDRKLLDRLPLHVAERCLCLPIEYKADDNLLSVAFADPLDHESIQTVQNAIHPVRLRPLVALATQIHATLISLRSQDTTPAKEPKADSPLNTGADENLVSGCIDLLVLAMSRFRDQRSASLCSAEGTSRFVGEVAQRLNLERQEIDQLRLAALTIDVAQWPDTGDGDGNAVLPSSVGILRAMKLNGAAEILRQLLGSTALNDPLSVTAQILITCRSLTANFGTTAAESIKIDNWRDQFLAAEGLGIKPAVIQHAIDVIQARYMRERLFAPSGELLLVGEGPDVLAVMRMARNTGFRVVRASDLAEATESVRRRHPHVACFMWSVESLHLDSNAMRLVMDLGLDTERILFVGRSGTIGQELRVPHVLEVDGNQTEDIIEYLTNLVHASHNHVSPAPLVLHAQDDTVVTGRLSDLGPADLIQVLASAQKTVRVDFHRDHQCSSLWLDRGNVIRAESGSLKGASVFYDLINWHEGHFDVRTLTHVPQVNVSTQTTALLLEALRRFDEKNIPTTADKI